MTTIQAHEKWENPQPTRKVITKNDGFGHKTTLIFEDRNSDNKLDLYSLTKFEPSYDNSTHIVTYYDNDGDGLVDKIKEEITSNIKSKDGKNETKVIESEFDKNDQKPKMKDVLTPPKLDWNV